MFLGVEIVQTTWPSSVYGALGWALMEGPLLPVAQSVKLEVADHQGHGRRKGLETSRRAGFDLLGRGTLAAQPLGGRTPGCPGPTLPRRGPRYLPVGPMMPAGALAGPARWHCVGLAPGTPQAESGRREPADQFLRPQPGQQVTWGHGATVRHP